MKGGVKMENTFKFKLVDCVPFAKGDKHYARLVIYVNFGYIINIFTTQEKGFNLMDECSKNKNFDISSKVKVYYDNTKQQFAYIIKN